MPNVAAKSRDWFRENDNRSGGREMSSGSERRSSGGNASMMPISYFTPLSNLFWAMDRMFEDTFRNFGMPALSGVMPGNLQMFQPKVDIASTEDEYTITIEVPGMEERDIRLEMKQDGTLIVSGEKRQESSENRRDVYYSECNYGSFERVLSLPEDVDQEGVEANFRNGLLVITCPRMQSSRQMRRQIPINTGRGGEGQCGERGAGGQQERQERADRGPQERSTPAQGPRKAA